jgi:Domain of unknown function (DUF6431)/CHC2 zinc finger
LDLLPRRCPLCGNHTIVGHGQRLRYARDDRHDRIWVRRGVCQPCQKTFTVLPDWLAPSAPFTLHCRQQACEHLAAGETAEQSAPHCKDPTHLPDPSTCVDGRSGDSSACGAGSRLESKTSIFCGPPSLRGIWARSAVFCRWRQEVHESSSSRRVETADFAAGLSPSQDWRPARTLRRGRLMGLCPLHEDHEPSFLVDPQRNLFYC